MVEYVYQYPASQISIARQREAEGYGPKGADSENIDQSSNQFSQHSVGFLFHEYKQDSAFLIFRLDCQVRHVKIYKMIETIAYVCGALAALFILMLLKPLLTLIPLKIKFGKQAYLIYKPFFGLFGEFERSYKQHGDMIKTLRDIVIQNPEVKFILTNTSYQASVLIIDPDYVKSLYVEHEHYDKAGNDQKDQSIKFDWSMQLLRQGLLMTTGGKWKQQRQLFSTSFTFDKLKARLPMINEVVRKYCQNDIEHPSEFFPTITGEVVIRSFFGEQHANLKLNGKPVQVEMIELFNESGNLARKEAYVLIKAIILQSYGPRFFPSKAEKAVHQRLRELFEFGAAIVKDRIQEVKAKPLEPQEQKSFLDVYVEAYLAEGNKGEGRIEVDEIVSQFFTLFFAGTDTTATTSVSTLYYLGLFPEIQEEIYQEIAQVVGDKDVDGNNMQELKKLDAFVNEVLRYRNPALCTILRHVIKDHKLKDLVLKKGTFVQAVTFLTQVSPKHFENPDVFDYSRWLGANPVKNDNNFVYLPFSAGGRSCIGKYMGLMELKIILCHVLRIYRITLKAEKPKWALSTLQYLENDHIIVFNKR